MYENSKGKEDSCRVEFRYENMPKHKLGTNPNTWKDKDSLWLLLSVAKEHLLINSILYGILP